MSARIFTDLTNRTASTADVALERLRDGEIVNRFTGASFGGYQSLVGSSGAGGYGRITQNATTNWPGIVAWKGSTILIDQTNPSANNVTLGVGTHWHFFNCTFIIRSNRSGTTTTQANQYFSIPSPGDVADGSGSSTTINYYGCNIIFLSDINVGSDENFLLQMSDGIYNNIKAVNRTTLTQNDLEVYLNGNSRFIGNTVSASAQGITAGVGEDTPLITVAGSPLIENNNIENFHLMTDPQNTSTQDPNTMVVTRTNQAVPVVDINSSFATTNYGGPRLSNSGRIGTNAFGYGAGDIVIHSIGGIFPRGNGVRSVSGDVPLRVREFGSAVVKHYGWRPRFWSDIGQTTPLQGVTVRVGSNVPLTDPTDVPSRTSFSDAITTPNNNINQTGLPHNNVYSVQSNTQGFIDLSGGVAASFDGGTTFTNGAIWDWFRLGQRAPGTGNNFAATFEGATTPPNTAIVPLSFIGGTFGNTGGATTVPGDFGQTQFSGFIEARHYNSTAQIPRRIQTGVIGTGEGQQVANSNVPIEDISIVGLNDVFDATTNPTGTLVATSVQQAFSLFSIPFGYSTQNMSDYLKAAWSSFQIGTLRDIIGGALVWTGGSVVVNSTNANVEISDTTLTFNRVTSLEAGQGPVRGIFVPDHTLTINTPANNVDLSANFLILNGDTGIGRFDTTVDNSITIGIGTSHIGTTFLNEIALVGDATFDQCDLEGGITFANTGATFTDCIVTGTINSPQDIDRVFSGGRYTGGIGTYGGDTLTFNNGAFIGPDFTLPDLTQTGESKQLVLTGNAGDADFANRARALGWTISADAGDYSFVVAQGPGRFAIRNLTKGVTSHQQDIPAAGQTITISIDDTRFDDNDQVRVYYKPDNDYTFGSEQWYYTTIFDFNWDTVTATRQIQIGVQPVPPELRSDVIYNGTDGNPATITTSVQDITDNLILNINNADQVGTGLSSNISKNLLSRAQNTDSYLEAMAEREREEDLIRFAPGGTVLPNGIVLTTDLTALIQQQIQGLVGIGHAIQFFTNTSIPTVNVFASELGLTIPDAQEAVDRSAVANGVGYMVGAEDSALVGIAPRNNGVDYDRTENYRGNI